MTRINLLPWRKERKQQRQKQLLLALLVSALAGLAVWAGGHMYYDDLINYQTHRNTLLQREIAVLDKKIEQIKELEATKARLSARMEIVQELQQGRPLVVHMLHQLVETLPDGVYFTSMKQTNNNIVLTGVAESNARISSLMESLDASPWLSDPRLSVIQVKQEQSRRLSEYTLQVTQKKKAAAEDGASKSAANKAPSSAARRPARKGA